MQKTASTKLLLLENWLDLQKWPRRVKKDLIAEEVKLEELDQAKELRIKEADKKFDQVKASLLLFTDSEMWRPSKEWTTDPLRIKCSFKFLLPEQI